MDNAHDSSSATLASQPEDRLALLLAGAPWALVSFRTSSGDAQAGVLTDDGAVRDLRARFPEWPTVLDLLAHWDVVAPELSSLQPESLPRVESFELDLPLRYPPKMIFAGANYHSHMREMGGEVEDGTKPFFFFKPPSTALVQDGAPIVVPEGGNIDWEAELGVVIGRHARNVTPAEALDYVAGYVVLNDVTDRSRLKVTGPVLGPPFAFDWLSSKAGDRSCPLGSTLVPASLVPRPDALSVRCWVNDELMQDSSTADMVADVPALIAAISDVVTLEPGDILATGTPAGVGAGRGRFLRPGDVITTEVAGVGRLTTPVESA